MTDDRTDDTPPPRPPLDVRTLVIASMASVIGALVVTRLGYAGKIAGAALAPIVVLLVTEFGHRSSARIEQTAEKVAPVLIPPLRRHPSAPGDTEDLPTVVLPPGEDGPTMHLPPVHPPGEGPPVDRPPVAVRSGSSRRGYTVHTGAQRARRSTRTRLLGILLAAACGVGVSVAAFTLLATASGGNVKLGSALQNSGGGSSKAKKTPATTTTTGSTQATTGSTSVSTSSTSSSTSTATSTVTSTVTNPASTAATASATTASTTTAPASTETTPPAPTGSGTAPAAPTTAPPDSVPAASTAATTPASTPSTTGG